MESQGNQRRLKLIRPNKIMQNLRPLTLNNKKKLAQALYYQNHSTHQSPLTRDEKGPVHQRLGVKQFRLKRFVPLGTNTSTLLPKKKLRPHMFFKQNKLQRMYSAQGRLERIRSQQRHNNNGIVKLRRLNRGSSVSNLTVEFKNPNYVSRKNGMGINLGGFYKFKMILDTAIQAEIEDIQRDSVGIVPLPPMTRITPVTTNMGISERFRLL